MKQGPSLLTLEKKKDPGFRNQVHGETSSHLPLGAQDQRLGARLTSLWVHRNLFWQLSRDGVLHGSGMSHATTVSSKPSFKVPWRWSAEGMLDGQHQKSGHTCPCQNLSQGTPAEKTGRGSLLNRPSYPPDNPVGPGTELILTETELTAGVLKRKKEKEKHAKGQT